MERAPETYLYHVTSKKNLDSILKKGLIPQYGDHCKQIHDWSSSRVFLSPYKDIDHYLRCFYDVDVILRIEPAGLKLEKRTMVNNKNEYGCKETIPPENISVYKTLEKPYFISGKE